MSTRRKKIAVACATLVVCGLIAWLVSLGVRSYRLYDATKGFTRGWRGSIYRGDAELGLAPIPLARADEVLLPLPDVPNHIDSRGFRVPLDADDAAPIVRPAFLALGCSGTFGSCVRAEETFAFRVAKHFGGTSLNAGLCSGGTAQQVLLARALIPRYRPDYVLLQYSPWLIDRAREPHAPSFTSVIPVPYFVSTPEGIDIQPPLFETWAFDVSTQPYRETERGLGDFIGFTLRVGVPLIAHDDVCNTLVGVRRVLGTLPKVAAPEQIETHAYQEIAKSCAEHGAKLIVVVMENGPVPYTAPESIRALGAPIAYGTNRMRARLPVLSRDAYSRTYLHTAGDPPVLIDAHPNALAHQVIAEEIVEVIERSQ